MNVPLFSRRRFLVAAAGAWPTSRALAAALTNLPQQTPGGKLPPIRAITRGPKFHWRGYYDKLLFDPTNRFVLANQVDFEHRSPRADDLIRVGMIDTQDGDKWIELGASRAWNWQQGCMLQWVPGSQSEVIWNDRAGDRFLCHVLDVKTGRTRSLPNPFYCLSPDGRWALAPDFRRLNDTRPGYGYCGLPDPNAGTLAPDNAGLWKMDLQTGRQELLLTFADAAKIPYPGGFSKGAKHWFNHLLFNSDGTRFLFLHRWRGDREGKSFSTRMFTANPDGKDLYVLDPHGKTSHFVWRDPQHVMAWAWHPSHGERFYLYRDRTDRVEVVGKDVMTVNGHNTRTSPARKTSGCSTTPTPTNSASSIRTSSISRRAAACRSAISSRPRPIKANGVATCIRAPAATASRCSSTPRTPARAGRFISSTSAPSWRRSCARKSAGCNPVNPTTGLLSLLWQSLLAESIPSDATEEETYPPDPVSEP